MKITHNGLSITEIEGPFHKIECSKEEAALYRGAMTPVRFTPAEVTALIEALREVQHYQSSADSEPGRILRLSDGSGDKWVWRDDHEGYVTGVPGVHDSECDLGCGQSLEWIEREWGPIKVLERG